MYSKDLILLGFYFYNELICVWLCIFYCFRVWFPCQDQTMSLGAKVWMDWPLGLLNITSKAHVLLSGKSVLLISYLVVPLFIHLICLLRQQHSICLMFYCCVITWNIQEDCCQHSLWPFCSGCQGSCMGTCTICCHFSGILSFSWHITH
jgi:hypothetical protein